MPESAYNASEAGFIDDVYEFPLQWLHAQPPENRTDGGSLQGVPAEGRIRHSDREW